MNFRCRATIMLPRTHLATSRSRSRRTGKSSCRRQCGCSVMERCLWSATIEMHPVSPQAGPRHCIVCILAKTGYIHCPYTMKKIIISARASLDSQKPAGSARDFIALTTWNNHRRPAPWISHLGYLWTSHPSLIDWMTALDAGKGDLYRNC
jgi:hypothetical protein